MVLDARAVKQHSEQLILEAGGQICDWLPHLEPRQLRTVEEIRDRALVMNALINLSFKAPVHLIADWVRRNGVEHALTDDERVILTTTQQQLTGQQLINLRWYLESLWALMWVGGVVDELDFRNAVPDSMASLCPDLQANEDGSKFAQFELRSYEEVFRELDLHFRLHWYARNGQLTKTPTPPVNTSVILERRKALEWVLDPSHAWDNVNLNT